MLIGKDIHEAARLLKSGKLVAIPTETVYGLAANSLDEEAVLQVFEAKKRPHFDPLIIHLPSLDHVSKYVTDIPGKLQGLAEQYMPGPLTLLLEKKEIIPDLVTSGSPMVAIRIPSHPITQALLKLVDFPLAAPSANPFGYISPTTAQHVADQLGNTIPYILDGGACEVGLESTIVGLESGQVTIYRKGGLEIEKIIACVQEDVVIKAHSTSRPDAPGMLTIHYAPTTPLALMEETKPVPIDGDSNQTAYLNFMNYRPNVPLHRQRVLSPTGDLHEAARNLFKYMRELDRPDFTIIYAEKLPDVGLGMAINDRLKRAGSK